MRTLFIALLIGLTFRSNGQSKRFACECSPLIEAQGLDTTAAYVLKAYSFDGTVSRNRSDELREGLRLEHGMEIRPTLQWFRQLGFCGDARYCLEKVRFIALEGSDPKEVLVQLLMEDLKPKK